MQSDQVNFHLSNETSQSKLCLQKENFSCWSVCFLAVQFQIVIQNRYKLNKKFRKICPPGTQAIEAANDIENLEQKSLHQQAKVKQKDGNSRLN